MRTFKELAQDIVNRMDEDAPANSVAGGGVDLAPNAAVSQSPHMIKRKKEQGDEQDKIKKKIGQMIKANEDNNSVLLKQVLDGLDKVDVKIDEKVFLDIANELNLVKDDIESGIS